MCCISAVISCSDTKQNINSLPADLTNFHTGAVCISALDSAPAVAGQDACSLTRLTGHHTDIIQTSHRHHRDITQTPHRHRLVGVAPNVLLVLPAFDFQGVLQLLQGRVHAVLLLQELLTGLHLLLHVMDGAVPLLQDLCVNLLYLHHFFLHCTQPLRNDIPVTSGR